MTVDALIDDLIVALGESGARVPAPPADLTLVRRLEAEIAPLRLPAALRRFWERIDPRTLALRIYVPPADLELCLTTWREMRDDVEPEPVGLFPWCYESHNHLLIELDAPGAAAGTIFEWGFGDSNYRLHCASLEDWLRLAAAAEREARFGSDSFRLDADRRLDALGPHPVYGDQRQFRVEREDWPAHWAPVMELARRRPPPRFPERSVAEVHAARRAGSVEATVRGRHRYFHISDTGTRIQLIDETGFLDVLLPVGVRGRSFLEVPRICVELEGGRQRSPRQRGDWFGASFGELLERFPPDAVAVEIRPAD